MRTLLVGTALLIWAHQEREAVPVPEVRIEQEVDVVREGPTVPVAIGTCTVFVEAQSEKNGPMRKVTTTGCPVGASGRCIIELGDLPQYVRHDDRWFLVTIHVQAGGAEMPPKSLRLSADDVRSMARRPQRPK